MMGQMVCANCGTEWTEGQTHCTSCGSPFSTESPVPQAAPAPKVPAVRWLEWKDDAARQVRVIEVNHGEETYEIPWYSINFLNTYAHDLTVDHLYHMAFETHLPGHVIDYLIRLDTMNRSFRIPPGHDDSD
jgi:hypothetical protein